MRSRLILLADTSDAFRDILEQELASTGYALLHAKNGQEAMDYLQLLKSEIELAIIELELPVVSGLEVIWQLVRREQVKPTKIIATTAVSIPLLQEVVKELGVAAIVQIPKPVQGWRKIIDTVLSGELGGYSQDTDSGAV